LGAGFGTGASAHSNYLINGDLWCKQQSRREAGLLKMFTQRNNPYCDLLHNKVNN
jgi:hypothetical protein